MIQILMKSTEKYQRKRNQGGDTGQIQGVKGPGQDGGLALEEEDPDPEDLDQDQEKNIHAIDGPDHIPEGQGHVPEKRGTRNLIIGDQDLEEARIEVHQDTEVADTNLCQELPADH